MSDIESIESIESESIGTAHSGDGSDYYQPDDNDFSDEVILTTVTATPANTASKESYNYSHNSTDKSRKDAKLDSVSQNNKTMSGNKLISAVNSKYEEQSYSQAFEEYDNDNEDEYDNDFEAYSESFEMDTSGKSSGDNQTSKSKHPNNQDPITKTTKIHDSNSEVTGRVRLLNVDSKSYEALQAELALEEISKEVLRLRMTQKLQIQQRRQMSQEKRQRAEKRRAQYAEEVMSLKTTLRTRDDTIIILEQETQHLAREISSLELRLHGASVENKELRQEVIILKENVEGMLKEKVAMIDKMVVERAEMELTQTTMAEEKQRLHEEVFRYQTLTEIVHKSMEANEIRLNKDRQNIPEYQQRLVQEQMERLKVVETTLNQREVSLKLEEERRLLHVDNLKRAAMEEVNAFRKHVEEDILREKFSMEELRVILLSEKQESISWMNTQRQQLESDQLKLQQEQQSIQAQRLAANDARIAAQQQKNLIEPYLAAATLQRDEAAEIKRQAQQLMSLAEDRLSNIIRKEKEVSELEHYYLEEKRRRSMEEIRLQDDKKLVISKASQLRGLQHELKTERFRLYNQAMEVSQAAFQLQQYLRQLRIHSTTNSSSTGNKPTANIETGIDKIWSWKGSIDESKLMKDLDVIHKITAGVAQDIDMGQENNKEAENMSNVEMNISSPAARATGDTMDWDQVLRESFVKDGPSHRQSSSPSSSSPSLSIPIPIDNNFNKNNEDNNDFRWKNAMTGGSVIDGIRKGGNTSTSSDINVDLIRSSLEVADVKAKQMKELASKYSY